MVIRMLNNRNLRTQLQHWSSYVFVVLIVGGGASRPVAL